MTDRHSSGALTTGRVVAVAIAGAAVGTVFWYLGVDAWFAAAVGCLVVVIGLVWTAFSGPSAVRWPAREPEARSGTRSDVSTLAWAFQTRHRSIRGSGHKALRTLASLKLARHGLDLDSPQHRDAIVRLLGERAYAALVPVGGILPSLGAVEQCLDALDALDALDLSDSPQLPNVSTPPTRGTPTP